jgi:hypothetical protein
LKAGLERVRQQLRCQISRTTLWRLLKAAGYTWKRMRRSLRAQRNEEDFRDAQQVLQELREYCTDAAAEFDLAYFDEAGFTLEPGVPYGWQRRGTSVELPSSHSPRLNVLGFLHLDGSLFSLLLEGTLDARVLIAAFDAYGAQLQRPTLLVLDNAPAHRSAVFQAQRERWEAAGLYLLFLPPYCPELNRIEVLWRKMKYEWLPLAAYQSFNELTDSLLAVLKQVGSKYRITFA